MDTPARQRRRKRRITVIVAIVLLLAIANHIRNRAVDRHAWPEPLPSIALVPSPAPEPAPGTTNAWDLLATIELPSGEAAAKARSAALAELRSPVGRGADSSSPSPATSPAVDAWLSLMAPALALWDAAAEAPFLRAPADLPAQYETLGRALECAALVPVRTTRARTAGDWAECRRLWNAAFRMGAGITHGTGTAGQVAAYDITLRSTRDILAALPLPAEVLPALANDIETALQLPVQPLSQSILHDADAARSVIDSFVPDAPPASVSRNADASERPSAFFRWIARRNGSSPAVSAAHFDAVLSHVVAAAEAPYTADGLYAKLPAWCRGRRPPWTNDPAAALAVCALRDNTLSAGVYPVLREMELRAALYAIRLESPGGAGDPSPVLCEAPADPFSTNGVPFVLDAPPPHWRFHSVGPDQHDDGGTNDWARAEKGGPGLDFLFAAPCPPAPPAL